MLKSGGDINLKLWLKHDKWYRDRVLTRDTWLRSAWGNIASVAYVRAFVEENSPTSFPLLERVVYSGTHSGDWVAVSEAAQLLTETRRLQDLTSDPSSSSSRTM